MRNLSHFPLDRPGTVEYTVIDGEEVSEFRLLTTITIRCDASTREFVVKGTLVSAEDYAKQREIELGFKGMKTHRCGPEE